MIKKLIIASKAIKKAEAKATREARDRAFKHNRDRWGLNRAKFIAVCARDKFTGRKKAVTADSTAASTDAE